MGETSGPEVIIYGSGDDQPIVLSAEAVRVLGVLVEKQITTPDYYPLTLNALVNGCNQSSSRDPVVSYDETIVTRAMNELREQKLAFVYSGADSRVVKFGHKLGERLELGPAEIAALCVLLLRGPQTPGEIRTRSGRLHEFAALSDAEAAIETLVTRQPHPLATKLPRQPGFKESRFAHLLSGPPVFNSSPLTNERPAPGEQPPVPAAADRITALEAEIGTLKNEMRDLRDQFAAFRKQFE
ncbi:MAG: YceH family protein [Opitutus sp.]